MTASARALRQASQPRRGLRREEAATYVGIGPSKFDDLVKDGRMPKPRRIDGVVVWDIVQLDAYFDCLPGDESTTSDAWSDGYSWTPWSRCWLAYTG